MNHRAFALVTLNILLMAVATVSIPDGLTLGDRLGFPLLIMGTVTVLLGFVGTISGLNNRVGSALAALLIGLAALGCTEILVMSVWAERGL